MAWLTLAVLRPYLAVRSSGKRRPTCTELAGVQPRCFRRQLFKAFPLANRHSFHENAINFCILRYNPIITTGWFVTTQRLAKFSRNYPAAMYTTGWESIHQHASKSIKIREMILAGRASLLDTTIS